MLERLVFTMYVGQKCSVPFGRFRIASRFMISVLAAATVGNRRERSFR